MLSFPRLLKEFGICLSPSSLHGTKIIQISFWLKEAPASLSMREVLNRLPGRILSFPARVSQVRAELYGADVVCLQE